MSADPEKVEAIKAWTTPKDKFDVKSFLQTAAFCQVFMKPEGGRTYSDVTKPLRLLTTKHSKFVWSKACQESFEELKDLLCSETVKLNSQFFA